MAPSPPTIVNKDVFDVTDIIDPDTIIPRTRTFQPKLVAVKRASAGQQWNFVSFYMLAAYRNGTEVKIPLDFTGKTRLICTQSLVRVRGKSVCLYCTIQDTPVVVWSVEEAAS